MKTHNLIYVLALTSTLAACGKKEDPQPPTATELLSAGKWQVRTSVLTAPGYNDVDLVAISQSCNRDDIQKFNLPNTYVYDAGTTKCDIAEPQTQLGVWSLLDNDKQLVVTFDGISTAYTVEELTATTLKVIIVRPQPNGTDATTRITLANVN